MTAAYAVTIEAAQSSLVAALAINGPEFFNAIKEAHDIQTGIAAVDALLSHCGGEEPSGHILKRASFLGSILLLIEEPQESPEGRQRQREARQAGDHIHEAAKLLQGLENGPLADLLMQLGDTVQAHSATSRIDPQRLAEVGYGNPIAGDHRQGHMLMCPPVPLRLSESFTGGRGRESRRANAIRMLAASLRADVPAAALARIMRDVLETQCSEADIVQALGRQGQTGPTAGSDLSDALRAWHY